MGERCFPRSTAPGRDRDTAYRRTTDRRRGPRPQTAGLNEICRQRPRRSVGHGIEHAW
jgi:hypothetical protein